MDRNQAKEFYPFLQAFAEGKIIETRRKQSAVKGTSVPNDWTEIKEIGYWDNIEYRVKPEPKYRPFKDAEECWTEMQKHQPFGWVKTGESIRRLITLVDVDRIQIGNQNLNWTYAQVFKAFIFMDGQPFGVKVEE
jgi:hypothetical protein|nr:MAG TPA: hypothetical protein [Caudoviricetes sp.]